MGGRTKRTSLDISDRSSSPVSSIATFLLLLWLLRAARALGGLPDDESRPVELLLATAGMTVAFLFFNFLRGAFFALCGARLFCYSVRHMWGSPRPPVSIGAG